jgi:hypothetical protein
MVEESKIKDFSTYPEVSKFILSLIQALLKTGYYTPGHPETQKAKQGLYSQFLSIIKGYREITFTAVTIHDKRDVLLSGITEEPRTISSFMLKSMAEMFVPKFLEYFDRRNLLSFSIKANISREEFETFIDIMSEPPVREDEKIDTKERLTLELLRKNILNVSTIFNIDLVGKDRRLPWRVEIALSRLKKDLSLIPLYKNLNEEKIIELKNMVFEDIIRPIKNPELIKDILLNMDIISSDIEGIGKEEFENKLTDFIHKDYLILAAPEVLKFFIFLKESQEKLHDKNLLQRLAFVKSTLRKVALKTIGYDSFDENLLMDFFKHGILVMDELPKELRLRIKRRDEIKLFLKEPERYFKALEKVEDKEKVEKIASFLLNFLPELITRDLYNEAEEIIKNVKAAGFNLLNIDSMLLDETISKIEKKLEECPKEEQARLLGIIDYMDEVSISLYMNLMVHKSRLVRKVACEKLIKKGKAVITPLKTRLKRRNDWYFIRNALMILSEVGKGSDGELAETFKHYLNHEEPRVRVEAIKGLANIMGVDAERLLIDALKDDDLSVKRKAIWALGEINSLRPDVISYFIDTITGKRQEDESIIEQILLSIQRYPPGLNETKQLEQAILEVISKSHTILGKFTAKYPLSEHLRIMACETLGYIGTQKTIGVLEKIARKDSKLRTKAIEAIERIKQSLP